jgi:hypothetical protein
MSIQAEVYCLKGRVLLALIVFEADRRFMQVISAEGLPPAPQSLKPPKAYVKVTFENRKWQTAAAHRSFRPSWDEAFQL